MFSFTIGSPGLSCSPMMDELYICVLILLLMQSVNKQYVDVPLIQFHSENNAMFEPIVYQYMLA